MTHMHSAHASQTAECAVPMWHCDTHAQCPCMPDSAICSAHASQTAQCTHGTASDPSIAYIYLYAHMCRCCPDTAPKPTPAAHLRPAALCQTSCLLLRMGGGRRERRLRERRRERKREEAQADRSAHFSRRTGSSWGWSKKMVTWSAWWVCLLRGLRHQPL